MLPTLRTERLRLEAATTDDVDGLWATWTEPDVRRYLWDDTVVDRAVAAEAVERSVSLASRGIGMWAIRQTAAPDPIGAIAVVPLGHEPPSGLEVNGDVELIYCLSRSCWGRGFLAEAMKPVVEHAFVALGLGRLIAVVDVPNAASHRSVSRAGFRRVGESDGPKYRMVWYALSSANRA